MILSAVFLGLMGFYAAFLWFCAAGFLKGRYRPALAEADLPWVTVIVPARNEAAGLRACLGSILANHYPTDRLELILVDDHSEDDTAAIAAEMAAQDARLRVIRLGTIQGAAYKKAAITAAIQQAQGTVILTTDADCVVGPEWVRSMAALMDADTALVSGPVRLQGRTPFGQMQALEFMGLIGVGAGTLAWGWPTMCNGANLAYRKTAWEAVGGFAGIDGIASGDDELLMHKMHRAGVGRLRFARCRAAIVDTDAQASWAAFRAQRLRWVSKSTHYRDRKITGVQALSWLALAGVPLTALLAVLNLVPAWLPLLLLGLKILGETPVLLAGAAFFDKLPLLVWFLPEQVLHIVYVLWVGLAGNVTAYTWKGRTVR